MVVFCVIQIVKFDPVQSLTWLKLEAAYGTRINKAR
jgi:hypothetical protein